MYVNEIKINNIKTIELLKEELVTILDLGKSSLLITFNLDFLRISYEDEKFKEVCKNAKLVLADGIGVTLLLRLKYGKTITRMTGNDIFNLMLEIANDKKLKLALVGSSQKSLDLLQTKLQKTFSYIILMTISPPLLFETRETDNNEVIDKLKSFKPDILIVALGCPRQELWLAENMGTINAAINVGVGAALDFYSGIKKRAPVILQKIGLEWLWRLFNEPKRLFRRYIVKDIPFYLKIFFRSYSITMDQKLKRHK